MQRVNSVNGKEIIGWREWVALPELAIPAIKVKVDTGARTSSLHTFTHDFFERNGTRHIRFGIHPLQRRTDVELFCEAPLVDMRDVTSSSGQTETRPVVRTALTLAGATWLVDLTLTDRDSMQFRMLLGREAMKGRLICDPNRSYVRGANKGRVYTPNDFGVSV